MNAIKFTDFDKFRGHGPAGAYCLMEHDEHGVMGMAIKCAGCGQESYLPLQENPGPSWTWDGNRESPTLSPSVFHTKERGGCGWHGFLQGGEWKGV